MSSFFFFEVGEVVVLRGASVGGCVLSPPPRLAPSKLSWKSLLSHTPFSSPKNTHAREIVALSGAHTLGRCHTDRSGFEGPWTNAPTTFSNLYFQELLNTRWTPRKWSGPYQLQNPDDSLMMLPTDIALIQDKKFKKSVQEFAKDEDAFRAAFASAFGRLLDLGVPRAAPVA